MKTSTMTARRPQGSSIGEATLELHLRAHGIPYEREVALIPDRKWRWDFLVEGTVAIEIQGQIWGKGGHSTGRGITRDCEKVNAATLAGYRVLLFTTEMVKSGEAIKQVLIAISIERFKYAIPKNSR